MSDVLRFLVRVGMDLLNNITNFVANVIEGGGGTSIQLGVLGMCRWTGCLFELPALAQGVFFKLTELGQGPFLSFQLCAPA